MESEAKLLTLLMEIGFLAATNGYITEAETIFNGIRSTRKDSEYPLVGLAVAKLNSGKAEEAVKILKDQALKINPENDLVKSYLGLAYKLSKKEHESKAILNEIVINNRHQEAVHMASLLLGRKSDQDEIKETDAASRAWI